MAAWDNYATKATPADADTMMIKDNAATGKPNKRVLFSGLWDWMVGKLANAVISTLTTNPKTVTGGMNALQTAVNTLNSKPTLKGSLTYNGLTFSLYSNSWKGLLRIRGRSEGISLSDWTEVGTYGSTGSTEAAYAKVFANDTASVLSLMITTGGVLRIYGNVPNGIFCENDISLIFV